jgi:hypothetical protein
MNHPVLQLNVYVALHKLASPHGSRSQKLQVKIKIMITLTNSGKKAAFVVKYMEINKMKDGADVQKHASVYHTF